MRRIVQTIAAVVILVAGARAQAHLNLTQPASRYGKYTLKSPPCGKGEGPRSTDVATFRADGIADKRGGTYRTEVTLPDLTCRRCTLQVIQVMYDKPPYSVPGNDIYYQCADLKLVGGGGDAGGGAGPCPRRLWRSFWL